MTHDTKAPVRALIGHVLSAESPTGLLDFSRGFILFDETIRALGPLSALPAGDFLRYDLGSAILCPGFIDAHVHLPQLDAMAFDGLPLLSWLDEVIYPQEARFADPEVAREGSERFVRALLANGTTSAGIYTSLHEAAFDQAFAAAEQAGLGGIIGKVLMDLPNPQGYYESTAAAKSSLARIIERWSARPRLTVGVTPRFALSAGPELLAYAGALAQEHALPVQSHLSENPQEVAAVLRRFPDCESYTAVYDRFGLLTPRTVMAHGLHLDASEMALLAERGSGIALCPSSNFFLTSGLVPVRALEAAGLKLGLGSDVGAGTRLSMFDHMRALVQCSKATTLALRDIEKAPSPPAPLTPGEAFYYATRGSAELLGLGQRCGRLHEGFWADLLVLDPTTVDPGQASRLGDTTRDQLSRLVHRGDERAVKAVFTGGLLRHGALPDPLQT